MSKSNKVQAAPNQQVTVAEQKVQLESALPDSKTAPVEMKASGFGIDLPPECSFVKTSGVATIAICRATPEPFFDKLLPSVPAVLVSLLALVISIRTYYYNRVKDAKARAQSIQDEFWIRKVVSPACIEPFLSYSSELISTLPCVNKDKTTKELVETHWAKQVTKLGEFYLLFHTLDLIDPTLDKEVSILIESFEDRFTSYCGQLIQHITEENSLPPDRQEFANELNQIKISVFKKIQEYQSKLGT